MDDIIVEIIAIFLNSSGLSRIGIKKYRYAKHENVKILVKPLKKVWFIPKPKIGNILSGTKSFEVTKKIISILSKIIGVITRLILAIGLIPALAEYTTGIKNNKSKNTIGVLSKYINLKQSIKYAKNIPAINKKNNKYKIPVNVFKNLFPKNSEISIKSWEGNGLNNLHISKQNKIAITLIKIILSQVEEPVLVIMWFGKLKIITLIVTITIKEIASNLLIFCNELIV